MITKYAYYAKVNYCPDDPSAYKYPVQFPDLDGAITEGRDLTEALKMASECLAMWIYSAIEQKENLNVPSPLESLPSLEKNESYHLIEVDLADYYTVGELFKIGLAEKPKRTRAKKAPEDRATRTFIVRLTDDEMEKLERIAKSEGTTKSGVVKRLIAKWRFE